MALYVLGGRVLLMIVGGCSTFVVIVAIVDEKWSVVFGWCVVGGGGAEP